MAGWRSRRSMQKALSFLGGFSAVRSGLAHVTSSCCVLPNSRLFPHCCLCAEQRGRSGVASEGRRCRGGPWAICWHRWEKTCFSLGARPCRGQSVQLFGWRERYARLDWQGLTPVIYFKKESLGANIRGRFYAHWKVLWSKHQAQCEVCTSVIIHPKNKQSKPKALSTLGSGLG